MSRNPTPKSITPPSLESLMRPGEPKLQESMNYIGQFTAARRLLTEIITVEKVALMTDEQVADELQRSYAVVGTMPERVIVVRRDKLEEFDKLVKYLDR